MTYWVLLSISFSLLSVSPSPGPPCGVGAQHLCRKAEWELCDLFGERREIGVANGGQGGRGEVSGSGFGKAE